MSDLKTIDKNIAAVRSNGDKFNALIHETAVMILEHAEEHGDCSRSQKLVMAMPASMRRETLITWFSTYSPIVVKNDSEWVAKMHKQQTVLGKPNPMYRPFNVEAAKAVPFYEIARQEREQKTRALSFSDIVKMVEQLGKRIEKQIEDGAVVDEDLEAAKQVAFTVQSLHFTKIKHDAENAVKTDEKDHKALLTDARKRYQDKFGKKAFAGWTLETIEQKLLSDTETTTAQQAVETAQDELIERAA